MSKFQTGEIIYVPRTGDIDYFTIPIYSFSKEIRGGDRDGAKGLKQEIR